MITFELYRQLDIRLYQTVAAFDPNYGSCARYILDGDSLILLGSNHSIRINMTDKSVSEDIPMKNWDIETEAILWFAEDSTEAAVIRMMCSVLRYYMQVEPLGTPEEFSAMVMSVNNTLAHYNLRILIDDSGMCVFHEDGSYTFEDAINLIMDIDENSMDEGGMVELINEALYYRKLDRMDEAAVRLEKVVRFADHSQPIYTDSVFLLGETYYFAGNFDRAVQLYYRCNLEFIESEDDFYMHLGHALLDERMKKYERQIRIFYRASIDEEYADTHRQAVTAASVEIGEVFEEYEKTCIEMGRKKYAQYRNNLPVGADDIDELLFFEKEDAKVDTEEVKRYKGIVLKEPEVVSGMSGKSIQEMLAIAYNYFMDGDYEKAFDAYSQIKEEATPDSDYATWAYFMIGKMYCIFDEVRKASASLERCDVNRFGKVYRQDDFLLLLSHVHILCEDFESDPRFRIMIRGRLDNYFSQYDREYNLLLRDRKLMKSYREYEKECIESALEEFSGKIDDKVEEIPVKKGFWGAITGIFDRR